MAKNRKTRKEKLRSATRHSTAYRTGTTAPTTQDEQNASVFTFSADSAASLPSLRSSVPELVLHLREDLLRTLTVTGAIVLAELILFFTLSH